jgi:hypothetical protein
MDKKIQRYTWSNYRLASLAKACFGTGFWQGHNIIPTRKLLAEKIKCVASNKTAIAGVHAYH